MAGLGGETGGEREIFDHLPSGLFAVLLPLDPREIFLHRDMLTCHAFRVSAIADAEHLSLSDCSCYNLVHLGK